MLESVVEEQLKRLEGYGFKSLKLRTPGYNGTKDRLILWPAWSPAPPVMVECKAPGKHERALQEAVRNDWRARGCDVRDMVDTPAKVSELCDMLLMEAVHRYMTTTPPGVFVHLPDHIRSAYIRAYDRRAYIAGPVKFSDLISS